MSDGEKCILIIDQSDLDYLLSQLEKKELLAFQFKFYDRNLFVSLLKSLKISYKTFSKKYYYYNQEKNLHIGESQSGYIWISTFGLIAMHKTTINSAVNSCINQYTVIKLLLEKAINISKSKSVHDIDSYDFNYLSDLSPSLFHNSLFYIEVFCKAYLSLNNITPPHTHRLSIIYKKTVDTMFAKGQNDSFFQVQILEPFYKYIDHINDLPSNFREHFVKYDDNPQDTTVIIFHPEYLSETLKSFDLSNDFMIDFFYLGVESHYLKNGLYGRLLAKAENEVEKEKISKTFNYLIEEQQ